MKAILDITSNSLHTCGVITGFYMLAKSGKLKLELNDMRAQGVRADALIAATVDDKRIVFDLSDGYRYDEPDAVQDMLESADVIFKRSYSKEKNAQLSYGISEKMHPYGFNYFVTYKSCPLTSHPISLSSAIKSIKLTDSYVSDMEAPVLRPTRRPHVLFLTRLWDPCADDIKGSVELKYEREYINSVRIETVRLLKRELGSSFFGGVYSDPFSIRVCRDIVVDKSVSLKRIYLARMKHSDICVNTMGLHESIGWKTAEYIAASRAIVSENFAYEVTGDFEQGKNYLAFSSPAQCVECVMKLVENEKLRLEMSRRNKEYYERYLRADAQLMRALEFVFGRKG